MNLCPSHSMRREWLSIRAAALISSLRRVVSAASLWNLTREEESAAHAAAAHRAAAVKAVVMRRVIVFMWP